MLRSCTFNGNRGQTEPIAALVAVTAVALALTTYGVATMTVLDEEGTDRNVQEQALDNVWQDIREGGVYDNTTNENLGDEIESTRSLPAGFNTNVSVINFTADGGSDVIAHAKFEPDGEVTTSSEGTPPDAQVATRSIAVEESPGQVRTMTLRVEVWES